MLIKGDKTQTTQRKGQVRTQPEDGYVHAKERGLRKNQPHRPLGPDLPASRTVRTDFSDLSPQPMYLVPARGVDGYASSVHSRSRGISFAPHRPPLPLAVPPATHSAPSKSPSASALTSPYLHLPNLVFKSS